MFPIISEFPPHTSISCFALSSDKNKFLWQKPNYQFLWQTPKAKLYKHLLSCVACFMWVYLPRLEGVSEDLSSMVLIFSRVCKVLYWRYTIYVSAVTSSVMHGPIVSYRIILALCIRNIFLSIRLKKKNTSAWTLIHTYILIYIRLYIKKCVCV
jgi:hypothetical protein